VFRRKEMVVGVDNSDNFVKTRRMIRHGLVRKRVAREDGDTMVGFLFLVTKSAR
jgi:hypothetical protein